MADDHLNEFKERLIQRASSSMNLTLNERYGNIDTAQNLHRVIHLIQLKMHLLSDPRDKMMYEFMIKLLSKWRDNYLHQGVRGVLSETGIDINQLLEDAKISREQDRSNPNP